jgi:murein DD-endopeptidase MepM/ murein hydrolase activator NlpD
MSDTTLITPVNQLPVDLITSSGSRLEGKLRSVQEAADDVRKEELKKAAQEFEAVFIAYMLKVMRDTIEESGLLDGGLGKSIYTEMFDQEVSLNMARHGVLGISDLLCRNLSTVVESDGDKSEKVPANQSLPNSPAVPQDSPPEQSKNQRSECEIEDFQLPVQGYMSSAFGLRKDPFSGQPRFHKGLDIAAPEGMKVVAALPGTVLAAGYEPGYGNAVVLQHADGIRTKYGHLASITVKAGDEIASQSALGTVGNTGRSTGPHLHFEVIRMGKPVDPLLSFNAAGVRLGSQNPKAGS